MLGQKFSLMVHVKFHFSLVAKGILFASVLLFFLLFLRCYGYFHLHRLYKILT